MELALHKAYDEVENMVRARTAETCQNQRAAASRDRGAQAGRKSCAGANRNSAGLLESAPDAI